MKEKQYVVTRNKITKAKRTREEQRKRENVNDCKVICVHSGSKTNTGEAGEWGGRQKKETNY
jgi:hypothetical protein